MVLLPRWNSSAHEGYYSSVMGVATPYELTGRTNQKARTRAAMVDATRELLAEGTAPTVEQAAERAGISRTTAYRYFPNQRALLLASYPELEMPSLLDADAPGRPRRAAGAGHGERRAPAARARTRAARDAAPLARTAAAGPRTRCRCAEGGVIGWLEDALAPLKGRVPADELRRLVLAIRATLGIEALVWLTDVGGLSREEAADLMRSSARTLLRSALASADLEEVSIPLSISWIPIVVDQ